MKKNLLLTMLFVMPFFVWAQWSNNPYQNTMINDSTGSQAVPMTVTNSSGETYISWYSATEGNRYDVFLQKLNENGIKLWDEGGLLISNHETISWVSSYDLQLDNDENVVLVTQDIRTGNSNVFAYKISPDGNFLWGNDGVQLSNTTGGDYSPKMAIANNNDVVFMWADEPADTLLNSKVFLKGVSSEGNILWESQIADTAYDFMLPQILHSENDDFIVSWMSKTNLPDTIIGEEHYMHAFAQKFDNEGNAVWSWNVPIDSGNIMLYMSLYSTPYLENDGDGGAYVLWQSFTPSGTGGVPTNYLNRIYNDGHIWRPNGYNVSQLYGNQHDDARMIYMENLDQIMVCWQEYEYEGIDCWGVYGQMFDATGQYIWDANGKEIIPLLCSVDTAYSGVLLSETVNNNAIVTYQKEYLNIVENDTALVTSLYSTSIDEDGEKIWDSEIVPLSLSASYKLHTVVSNIVNNQLVFVWEDNISNPHNNFNTGIYAQNLSSEGEIGPLGIFDKPSNDNSGLIIYPNPSEDFVHLNYETEVSGILNINLLDVNGRIIKRLSGEALNAGNQSKYIDISDFESGIYFIQLQTNKTTVCGKLIKK